MEQLEPDEIRRMKVVRRKLAAIAMRYPETIRLFERFDEMLNTALKAGSNEALARAQAVLDQPA